MNGQENNSGTGGSGGGGSNLAYLDSTAGNRNISGSGISHTPASMSGNGNNTMYIPIFIVCCPNLLKNEQCYCGH